MAKPNFRWFGSEDNAIVFDVDDVSRVEIKKECPGCFREAIIYRYTITINFYHQETVEIMWNEVAGITDKPTAQYQQVYDWARNDFAPDKVNEMENSLD